MEPSVVLCATSRLSRMLLLSGWEEPSLGGPCKETAQCEAYAFRFHLCFLCRWWVVESEGGGRGTGIGLMALTSGRYVKTYLLPDRSSQGKRKTGVQRNTVDPTFQETLQYQVAPAQLVTRRLQVSVWHLGALARRVFLGEVIIPLATWDFEDSTTQSFRWHPLRAKKRPPLQDLELRIPAVSGPHLQPWCPFATAPAALQVGEASGFHGFLSLPLCHLSEERQLLWDTLSFQPGLPLSEAESPMHPASHTSAISSTTRPGKSRAWHRTGGLQASSDRAWSGKWVRSRQHGILPKASWVVSLPTGLPRPLILARFLATKAGGSHISFGTQGSGRWAGPHGLPGVLSF
nr:uncharacterized protein LOC105716652 isoform X2 [Aotus nancymaae]